MHSKTEETFPSSNSVTFYLSFIWTYLVSIDFIKCIPKSLFSRFNSFQTTHNLGGQKKPLFFLCFKSSQIGSIIASPVVLRVHRRLSLSIGRKQAAPRPQGTIAKRFRTLFNSALILILTYMVLLWKSCSPEIRWINKWYPACGIHETGCRNIAVRI